MGCGDQPSLQAVRRARVHRFIFSSSATVYGAPQYLPIDEQHPVGQGLTNPYGWTKFMVERILMDLCRAEPVIPAAEKVAYVRAAMECRSFALF
jgi:UDP-glucose 4-epimerase